MSVSELDAIVLAADTEKCARFFEAMPESQRKLLSGRALQWASAVNGYMCRGRQQYAILDPAMASDMEFYQNIQSDKVVFPKDFTEASCQAARMAVLATCGFPELKKAGILGLPEAELAATILKSRKPSWLSKWCAYVVKEFPVSHWLSLYELEKSGVCLVERDSGYWLSMLCGLARIDGFGDKLLAKDENLRAELWDMLADPGVARMLAEPEQISHEIFRKTWRRGGNIFAPKQIGDREGTKHWMIALEKLASQGLMDRNRLVEYSFTALCGAGEKEVTKSAYGVSSADFAIRLNQSLVSSDVCSYRSRFAALLSANHKDVATYAATMLLAVPDEQLVVAEVCSCIAPIFINRSKEPAEVALKLLARLANTAPSKRSDFGPAILAALSHSSKDIQRKALALIESTKILDDPNLLSEFGQRIDMLGGMERTNAAKLLEKHGAAGEKQALTPGSVTTAHSGGADELIDRANKLDATFRSLTRIDEAIAAIDKLACLDVAVTLDSLQFPRLNPSGLVKPITNLDDLIYMFSKVWNGKSEPLEFEAVLDGLSRLCNEHPPDFNQKTDALRTKAEKIVQESPSWISSITHLALSWLVKPDSSRRSPTPDTTTFFGRRCHAVALRAAARQSAPLLAAPTHAGGWIAPEVLVKRMIEYFWRKEVPDESDFIQALLRLAPDNREAALASAETLKGEMGECLRYALGGGDLKNMKTPEFWVAAFRAREPKGTSAEIMALLPHSLPDAAEPAAYGFDIEPLALFAKDRYASMSNGLPYFLPVINANPSASSSTSMTGSIKSFNRHRFALFPTVLLHDNLTPGWGNQAYNWLHNRESLLALVAKCMVQRLESIDSVSVKPADIEFLFDPDISLDGNGCYVLCTVMSQKQNDLARLAVDALISAIGEIRISGGRYGAAMASMLPSGVITPVRWTRGLRDVSRTSPLHAHFVWLSVCTLVEQAKISATQLIPFMELLVELQLEHKFQVGRELSEALSRIPGGGKTGKLAKTILAFHGQAGSELPAALQDLQARVERAERWQTWSRAGRQTAVV